MVRKKTDCFKGMEHPEDRIAAAMIRAQADLHLVDYEAADLSKLGRPEGFLERHYKEMPRTMLRYAIEKLPEMERLAYLRGTK